MVAPAGRERTINQVPEPHLPPAAERDINMNAIERLDDIRARIVAVTGTWDLIDDAQNDGLRVAPRASDRRGADEAAAALVANAPADLVWLMNQLGAMAARAAAAEARLERERSRVDHCDVLVRVLRVRADEPGSLLR